MLSFRSRTDQGQVAEPSAVADAAEFAADVRKYVADHAMFNVYNADQTAVFFEMLPKKTIDQRGQLTVWVKCGSKEKERATAMVMADWCGKPCDLFLVFKVKP
ncbi:TPA: hypothetical protein N0F65_006186 [Lagenidium giganteum]|uniref:Uncharacterized protein n=1 Tax=Lagenidium giganteum TaxID=4803 RepID=A0AAV2Z7N1_9STRA|nr:TPA: hypothetical protein N0F65_006186 [Lagenidium giganteum]